MTTHMRGVTTLSIAHRLSTIQGANVIIVMHNGHVEEVGNHATLAGIPNGRYAKLVESQTSAKTAAHRGRAHRGGHSGADTKARGGVGAAAGAASSRA